MSDQKLDTKEGIDGFYVFAILLAVLLLLALTTALVGKPPFEMLFGDKRLVSQQEKAYEEAKYIRMKLEELSFAEASSIDQVLIDGSERMVNLAISSNLPTVRQWVASDLLADDLLSVSEAYELALKIEQELAPVVRERSAVEHQQQMDEFRQKLASGS